MKAWWLKCMKRTQPEDQRSFIARLVASLRMTLDRKAGKYIIGISGHADF